MDSSGFGEKGFLSFFNVYVGKNFIQKSILCARVSTCTIPVNFNRVMQTHQMNIPLSAYVCIYRKSFECHILLLPKGVLHYSKQAIAHCNTRPGK